jgi:hypothetical protein
MRAVSQVESGRRRERRKKGKSLRRCKPGSHPANQLRNGTLQAVGRSFVVSDDMGTRLDQITREERMKHK